MIPSPKARVSQNNKGGVTIENLDNQKVLEQFAILSNISIEHAANYSNLVNISISDIEKLLKEDVNVIENSTLLNYLCGAVCCYKYTLSNSINEPINIKNLGISVSNDNDKKIKSALMIKNEAIISARNLLKDNDFFFGRVI